GFAQTVRAIGATLSVPKMLIEGSIAPADARLIGLVGMAQATSETVSYVVDTGFWYPLFVLTGLFSAGLSIANMLPIPALDRGRQPFALPGAGRRAAFLRHPRVDPWSAHPARARSRLSLRRHRGAVDADGHHLVQRRRLAAASHQLGRTLSPADNVSSLMLLT